MVLEDEGSFIVLLFEPAIEQSFLGELDLFSIF